MPFRCTLLLILSTTLTPALAADRHLISWSQHDGRLDLTVSDGVVRIQPYTDKIVETTFVPAGERVDPVSHAVVLKPAALPARAAVREHDGGLEFDLGALGVTRARFVRIRDSGKNRYVPPSGGFDLDAISLVHALRSDGGPL
jgi:hypothetical protein